MDGKKTFREDLPWSSSGEDKVNILSAIVDSGVTQGTTDAGYEPKSKAAPAAAPAADADKADEKASGEDSGIIASIAGAAAAGAGVVGATVASLTGSGEEKESSSVQPPGTGAPIASTATQGVVNPPINTTLYTTGAPSVVESRQGQVLTQSVPIGHARLDDIDAPVRPAPAISTDYAALLRQTGPVETTATYLQPVTATKSTAPSVPSSMPSYAATGAATGAVAGSATGAATGAATASGAATSGAEPSVDNDSHEPWSVEWPQSASKSQSNFNLPDPLLHAEKSAFGTNAWSVKEGQATKVDGSAAALVPGEAADSNTTDAATGAGAGVGGLGGAAAGAAGAAGSDPKQAATGAADDAKKAGTGAVDDAKNAGTGVVDDAKKAGTGAVDDVKKAGTDAAASGKDAAKSGNVSGIKDAATDGAENVKKSAAGAASDAKGKAEEAPKKLGFIGKLKKAFKK